MAPLSPAPRMRPLDWGDDEAATRVQQDAASLSLIARDGPMSGHVFGSDGDAITIGRGSGCAVRLALTEISRRHASIRYHAGRYWVEDLQTLNGTKLNHQLIERPTALNQGDRIRVGTQEFEVRFGALANRQMVCDGPNSDGALAVSSSPRASGGVVSPPLRLIVTGAIAVLAVGSGVLLAFAFPRHGRRASAVTAAVQPSPGVTATNDTARPAASTLVPPPAGAATPPAAAPAPARARIEVEGAVALAASEAGSVQWAAARGTPVRAGDELIRFRRSNAAKQRELERLNAELEDDENNPELIRRAHTLAYQVGADGGTATLKSGFDGVVVATLAPGARVQAGVAEVRVARMVRLVVDAGAIVGGGSACRISFLDQKLEADGRRVVSDAGATIELTRFPAALSFENVGRVRAECK
jgi:hypothetical protein